MKWTRENVYNVLIVVYLTLLRNVVPVWIWFPIVVAECIANTRFSWCDDDADQGFARYVRMLSIANSGLIEILFAAAYEEILFRDMLHRMLTEYAGTAHWAGWISQLIFALAHTNGLNLFSLVKTTGILMTSWWLLYIYNNYGVWASIACHFGQNAALLCFMSYYLRLVASKAKLTFTIPLDPEWKVPLKNLVSSLQSITNASITWTPQTSTTTDCKSGKWVLTPSKSDQQLVGDYCSDYLPWLQLCIRHTETYSGGTTVTQSLVLPEYVLDLHELKQNMHEKSNVVETLMSGIYDPCVFMDEIMDTMVRQILGKNATPTKLQSRTNQEIWNKIARLYMTPSAISAQDIQSEATELRETLAQSE